MNSNFGKSPIYIFQNVNFVENNKCVSVVLCKTFRMMHCWLELIRNCREIPIFIFGNSKK